MSRKKTHTSDQEDSGSASSVNERRATLMNSDSDEGIGRDAATAVALYNPVSAEKSRKFVYLFVLF